MQGCDIVWIADWIQRALGNDQPMLKSLQSGSEELVRLSRDFWNGYGKLPITCFFEKRDTAVIGPLAARVRKLLLFDRACRR